jgi:flagellar hook-associated protein 2
LRITGLASGLDTETMIKDMMKAHRMPLNKIFQQKQYMEWQRDDYRTINRQLNDMSNKTLTQS